MPIELVRWRGTCVLYRSCGPALHHITVIDRVINVTHWRVLRKEATCCRRDASAVATAERQARWSATSLRRRLRRLSRDTGRLLRLLLRRSDHSSFLFFRFCSSTISLFRTSHCGCQQTWTGGTFSWKRGTSPWKDQKWLINSMYVILYLY